MKTSVITISKLLPILLIMGCASRVPAPPMSVQAMPNDCANRVAIINWLSDLERKQTDERYRGEIRAKIWTVRYNCQPV
jgi:hypothetical protein